MLANNHLTLPAARNKKQSITHTNRSRLNRPERNDASPSNIKNVPNFEVKGHVA
jgi:hypothetical protein